MMEAHDERYIQDANFRRTIAIPTLGVRTTEFEIDLARKENMFQTGYEAARKFFEGYSDADYKKDHPRFKRTVS